MVDRDLAVRRLQRWREQPPFTNDALFARRLAADGIGEEELLQLLGEPAESVRDRLPHPPAWLCEVVEAFSRSSPESVDHPDLPPDHQKDGFLWLATPLIRRGREHLRRGVCALAGRENALPFDPDTVEDLLAAGLPDLLVRMMTRTMVLELHVARLQGLIEGDSPEERFESFLRHISDLDTALALFQEYPVLARQLTRCIDHWLAASLEFLERLCADWEAIRTRSPAH